LGMRSYRTSLTSANFNKFVNSVSDQFTKSVNAVNKYLNSYLVLRHWFSNTLLVGRKLANITNAQ
jgi:hypothetical protein